MPELASAHYLLGLAYTMESDFQSARNSLKKALGLRPMFARAHLLMSEIEFALGDNKEAIQGAEKVAKAQANNLYANLLLGRLYLAATGNNAAAIGGINSNADIS